MRPSLEVGLRYDGGDLEKGKRPRGGAAGSATRRPRSASRWK